MPDLKKYRDIVKAHEDAMSAYDGVDIPEATHNAVNALDELLSELERKETVIRPSSGHGPAPTIYPYVTRVSVIAPHGLAFENYKLYPQGAEVHLQDEGRTLKVFPKMY